MLGNIESSMGFYRFLLSTRKYGSQFVTCTVDSKVIEATTWRISLLSENFSSIRSVLSSPLAHKMKQTCLPVPMKTKALLGLQKLLHGKDKPREQYSYGIHPLRTPQVGKTDGKQEFWKKQASSKTLFFNYLYMTQRWNYLYMTQRWKLKRSF